MQNYHEVIKTTLLLVLKVRHFLRNKSSAVLSSINFQNLNKTIGPDDFGKKWKGKLIKQSTLYLALFARQSPEKSSKCSR